MKFIFSGLYKQFIKNVGRAPNSSEINALKKQAFEIEQSEKIIQFPPKMEFPPKKNLKEFKASEDVYEQSMKPKGEVKTKFEKELGIKLYGDETYGELMEIKNTGKHPRDKADGGRIGFKVGGILDLLKLIRGKYGKKAITTADKIKRPQSALDREMFDAANKRFNKKVKERTSAEVGIDDLFDKDGVLNKDAVLSDITKSVEKTKKSKIVKTKTPDKALEKALDEVGGNFTGDLKYDADVLADELAFQRGLIPEGGDLSDIVDQDIVSKIYNEAYGSVSGQFLKNREIKKMQQFSKPTKTLEGIKDTGTIDISDPKVADEFSRFMKESDPKSYKDLQQKVDLMNFDPKKSKGNADGGRIGYKVGSLVNLGKGIINLLKKKPKPKPKREKFYGVGGKEIDVADLKKKFGLDAKSLKQADDSFEIRLQQILSKHSTKHADGGLAHMLGEPRSMYSGGGAGMPPVAYGPGIDISGSPAGIPTRKIGPVDLGIYGGGGYSKNQVAPGVNQAATNQNFGITAQIPIGDSGFSIGGNYEKSRLNERYTGDALQDSVFKDVPVDNDRFNVGINYKRQFADGGRIGFDEGGMNRRGFLKLAAGLASLPIIGKYFKFAKGASKIKVLGNTTTTMPAWFPDLVDKFMIKGIGKKIDADLMEYTVKDLPGVKLAKHDDGRVFVKGKNDYSKSYEIEYEPPGYEVLDEVKGKTVKTKGEFRAQEEVPVNVDPDGNVDFDGEILESVDDILSGDARAMEEFATGKKIKDFAKGGLAGMLGE